NPPSHQNETAPTINAMGSATNVATRTARALSDTVTRRQRWTTEHVRVRVMPGTSCTLLTIIFPSSSTLCASVRTTTSYGPVTASTRTTPLIPPIWVATSRARPTSVWMRMYAWTTTRLLYRRPSRLAAETTAQRNTYVKSA